MDATEPIPAAPEALLHQYDLYRKVVETIIGEIADWAGEKRSQLAFKKLGVDLFLLRSYPRLKYAACDYLYFSDRRKGSTLFENWYRDYQKKSSHRLATFRMVVDALARSRFSAFEIEQVHTGLGVTARDILSGDRHLVVDRLMSQDWETGMQFATRIIILPEFTMTLCESIESAVKPGQDFTGGQLSEKEQVKLQAVAIEMFRDALLSC
jgi:hypothetical protein